MGQAWAELMKRPGATPAMSPRGELNDIRQSCHSGKVTLWPRKGQADLSRMEHELPRLATANGLSQHITGNFPASARMFG